MRKTTIAAVVLTKNEERNLSLCLRHLRWVDDIIVVDSGSTDSTLDIAKRFGARVLINIPAKFIIAEQRNWVLDHIEVKTEWVMFIDADEIITEKLKNKIIEAISSAPPEIAGFQLCFKFMFLDKWVKHTYDFPTWHDRLLRYGKVRFKGGVWESFEAKGKIGKIYEPYLHYGFNNGMNSWIDRHQRYAEWKAEEILNLESQGKVSLMKMIKELFSFNTLSRKRIIERIGTRLGILSPFLRFLYYYFIKRGFLDGKAGLVYSLMMVYYQFMIYLHLLEKKRRQKNLPL